MALIRILHPAASGATCRGVLDIASTIESDPPTADGMIVIRAHAWFRCASCGKRLARDEVAELIAEALARELAT